MVHHIVLFKVKTDVPLTVTEQLFKALDVLGSEIEEIRSWDVVKNFGTRPNNFDFALIASFRGKDSLNRYVDNPAHLRFLENSRPIIESTAVLDYES